MNTRFRKTSLALALSAMLLPYYCAAGEPTEGVKPGLVTLDQEASQRNDVPVYFIGSYQDNLVLQNAGVKVLHNALERQDKMAISHFDFKSNAFTPDEDSASSRLVVVDGNYVANLRPGTWEKVRAYLQEAALAGNPVIAIGDLSIGMGLYADHEDPNLPRDSETNEVVAKAFGIYWSPQGHGREFGSNEVDIVSVMKDARSWAKDVLEEQDKARFFNVGSDRQLKASNGWVLANYARNYMNNDCPYGRLHVKTKFYKLVEPSTSRDYWQVHLVQRQHPGHLSSACTGSDWNNADAWNVVQVDRKIASADLYEYSPTTSSGTSTTTVTLGANLSASPGYTASVAWGYATSDIMVRDQTFGNTAKWWHDINENASVGWNTVTLEPGLIADVPQGTTAIYNQFYELYQGQWHRCKRGPLGTCWRWYLSGYRGFSWN